MNVSFRSGFGALWQLDTAVFYTSTEEDVDEFPRYALVCIDVG